MKNLLFIAALLVAFPFISTGCQQAPSARVVQVQTLRAVGESAEAAVALSAQLYRDGRISAVQANQVRIYYDFKFQPVYRLAVSSVKADLTSIASPDVLSLANELSALVISFQTH